MRVMISRASFGPAKTGEGGQICDPALWAGAMKIGQTR